MKKTNYLAIPILFVVLAIFLLGGCGGSSKTHQIAFESERDGNSDVYLVDADGENLVRLTDDPAYDGTPNWSPDGRHIAFTSERSGNAELHSMAADGSNVQQLTEGDGVFSVMPAWSPDGSKIVFVSNRTYGTRQQGGTQEVEANTKLWAMAAEGGKPERLTTRLGLDMFASWSPDSQSIVYMSIRDDNSEIYLRRPDKLEVNLTDHPARDTNPDWSPDGKKVVFMSDREGSMDIFVMDIEDRTVTNITQHPAADGDPAWSPDGSHIAFISDRDGNAEIYVMASDGSDIQRITNDPADDILPQWRPSQER